MKALLLILALLFGVNLMDAQSVDQYFEPGPPNQSMSDSKQTYNDLVIYLSQFDLADALEVLSNWERKNVESLSGKQAFLLAVSRAYLYLSNGKYQDYLKCHRKAARICLDEDDKVNYSTSLNLQGYAHHLLGNIDSALYFVNYSIEYLEKNDLIPWIAHPYITKAEILRSVGNMQGAKDLLIKAYEMPKIEEVAFNKKFTLYSLLSVLFEIGDMDAYRKYTNIYADLLKLDGKKNPDNHFPIKDMILADDSDTSVERMLEICRQADEYRDHVEYAFFFAAMTLYEKSKTRPSYRPQVKQVLINLNEKLDTLSPYWKANTLGKLSLIEEEEGNIEAALRYAKEKEEQLLISLGNKNREQLNELEAKYDLEQKEKEILAQKLALEQETQKRNALSILLGLVIASLLLLWRWQIIRQKDKTALAQVELERVKSEKELQVAQAIIQGEEQERGRIAQEIHDGLGGLLTTTKRLIQEIKHSNASDPIASKAFSLIDEACTESRRISHNMSPNALKLAGLKDALGDMIQQFNNEDTKFSLFISDGIKGFSADQEKNIFRIIQETCNNITKHANARNAFVQIHDQEDNLRICVEDDGIGFDNGSPNFNPGIGLSNIASRVKYLKGDLQIDSAPSKGTSIIINIPNPPQ